MNKKILIVVLAVLAVIAGIVLNASGASAANPTDSAPANYVATAPHRVLDTRTDGPALDANDQVTVNPVAPTGATAVVVNLTVTDASTNGFVTAFPTGTTRPTASSLNYRRGVDLSNAVTVQLSANGTFVIYNHVGTVDVVVDVEGYFLPAAPALSPAAFGVANIMVHTSATSDAPSNWGSFDTVLAGAPVGDIAAGFTRFTCKLANGCDLTVTAYATVSGEVVYPDVLLTREDNTTGGKFTCEYADGSDNNGATTALTGTKASPTAVSLGIGSTADCGGNQTGTQPASVDHINVPGAAGQGLHYDVDVKFVFAQAAA